MNTSFRHSLVTFDTSDPQIQAAVADVHQTHRLVMSGFRIGAEEGTPRAGRNVLYTARTVGTTLQLLVQADEPGRWDHPALVDMKSWEVPVPAGWALFQITVVPALNSSGRGDGLRRRPINDLSGQLAWLRGRLEKGGARLGQVDRMSVGRIMSATKDTGPFSQPTATFAGRLAVTDLVEFWHMMRHGVGPGKAYGCGLLLTRPA